MKLRALYSNADAVFPAIHFRDGLNVVFARVRNPKERDRDSHNLGKTFLAEVIDYALLKTINKDHPFRKFPDLFGDFVFFLELQTTSGKWVTVRRAVQGKKNIKILVAESQQGVLEDIQKVRWTYDDLSQTKGEEVLNTLLGLDAIVPFDFRKGLGHILRRQSDWEEVFFVERFRRGRDKDWKPYIARLLGFNASTVTRKYELEDDVNSLETLLRTMEREAGSRTSEYGRVKGLIELKQAAVARQRAEVDEFSFSELEAEVNKRAVTIIESDIVRLNEQRYNIDYELQEIERSLKTQLPFDLARIQQVFEEANIALSTTVKRSYEELLAFNRRLSSGRATRLEALRTRLTLDRDRVENDLRRLDVERQDALRILKERETFQKYVRLQSELRSQEQEIGELERRLDKLDVAATTQKQIQEKQSMIADIVEEIDVAVRTGSPRQSEIRKLFADNVRRILSAQALLAVTQNESGNLDFDIQTLDRTSSERETSEGDGTSYRKMLCACFDLALLASYSSANFYRFVYHDGALEGLDNRRKVSLLTLVRELTSSFGLQYIVTVIDTDLPRDDRDHKLLFPPEEIVRELHDQGDDGRLFRMQAF